MPAELSSFMLCHACAATDAEALAAFARAVVATGDNSMQCDICCLAYRDVRHPEKDRGAIMDCQLSVEHVRAMRRRRFIIRYDTLPDPQKRSAVTLFWTAQFHPAGIGHLAGTYESRERGMHLRLHVSDFGFPEPTKKRLGHRWLWKDDELVEDQTPQNAKALELNA